MTKKISKFLLGAVMILGSFAAKAQSGAPLYPTPTLVPGQTLTYQFQGKLYILQVTPKPGQYFDEVSIDPISIAETDANTWFGQNFSALAAGNNGFYLELIDAPFDAGLSVLLGAGAIAAAKRARNRKKQALA